MQVKTISMVTAGALVLALAANSASTNNGPAETAVAKGARWIASVQGRDGGWGQDGGETSYVRQNEHLETNGNDVANTAVAALALRQAGNQYQGNVERALDFILRSVENSPADGLTITNRGGTQIQRKLGPYIDTFLTSRLLSEVDGTLPTAAQNAQSAARRELERRRRMGSDSRNFDGVAQSLRRAAEGRQSGGACDGCRGELYEGGG